MIANSYVTFIKDCFWIFMKWCGITLAIVAVFILFFVVPAIADKKEKIKKEEFNARAVELGFAQYSTDSGKFYWVNKNVEYLMNGKK